MKPSYIFLSASLALNAALAIHISRQGAPDSNRPAPLTSEAGESRARTDARAAAPSRSLSTEVLWHEESETLSALLKRLRNAGWPDHIVRAIAAAHVREKFAAQRERILRGEGEVPYWQNSVWRPDPKRLEALQAISREESQMIRELLGGELLATRPLLSAAERRSFGSVPPEKLLDVRQIVSDYSTMRSEIVAAAGGVVLPEDRQKLALLEKEQQADLARILTPVELEEFQLRNGTTAAVLRAQLATFEPTEEEFRAIHKARRAVDEEFDPLLAARSPESRRQRQEALQKSQEQLREVLGPERFGDYRQATDPAAQTLNNIVNRFGLPLEAGAQVMEVRNDYQSRARKIGQTRELTPQQREAALAGLVQEANARVGAILGQPALEAYRQTTGSWLTPPASRRSPPLKRPSGG